jgi:hypothetical protein
MATTLTLTNKVLRGIRQFGLILASSATAYTDDYLLMLLQFINEAKEEIEESGWAWQSLRTTVTVTLAADTAEYDITIAGAADVDTNDRARLLYENAKAGGETFYQSQYTLPQVFDVTDSGEYRLVEVRQEKMERMHFTDSDETQNPVYFAIWSDGDSLRMKVHPTPNSARTLKLRVYIPQVELTASDITTVLSIPSRPVWTLALHKANQERGDELGKDGSSTHRAALDAHGAAVGKEMTAADQTTYLER